MTSHNAPAPDGRPPPFVVVGRLCLDFAQTAWPARGLELLRAPEDLARWLTQSSLAVEGAAPGPRELAAARELRAAIWDGVQSVLHGRPLPPAAVEAIDRAAAAPPLVPELAGTPPRARWRAADAGAALSDLARDAIALLGHEEQRARTRECANPDCQLVFFDDSRPGRRRWCAPNRCGDRLRARAYRARRSGAEEPACGSETASASQPNSSP